jgi:hypothetical protein
MIYRTLQCSKTRTKLRRVSPILLPDVQRNKRANSKEQDTNDFCTKLK